MELKAGLAKLTFVETENQAFFPAPVPGAEAPVPMDVQPSPNNPSWGPLEAVGVWVASVLLILFVPLVFLLPYMATLDPPITDGEKLAEFAKNDPTAILLQILAVIPAHLFTVLLAWLVVTRGKKFPFRQTLGWRSGGFQWWHYAVILAGFFVLAAIVGSFVPEQDNDLLRILGSSRSAVYVIAFVATFTAPFVEELVYRGVLYSAFQRKMGIPAAFILVTLLFALVHVPQYYPSYSTILLLGLLSLILTSIRYKTNNLWPCVVLHTLFNGIQSAMFIAEPFLKDAKVPDPSAVFFHLFK